MMTCDEMSKRMNTQEYWEIKKAVEEKLNSLFPYKETEYRNGSVAHIVALGHKDKLTEDWMRKAFLQDIEDDFITYAQVMTIKDSYWAALEEINQMF